MSYLSYINDRRFKSAHKIFLEQLKMSGGDENEIFTSLEEFVNDTYSSSWRLSNTSNRGKTTSLKRLYELGLSFADTHLLLKVFKYWAQTTRPGTTDSRIGVICQIIKKNSIRVINDITYLKVAYGKLTLPHKKNLNYLFLVLNDTFLKSEFKEQRAWTKDNLEEEKVNPHDPVNGAYSNYEFNKYFDQTIINLEISRQKFLDASSHLNLDLKPQRAFHRYSNEMYRMLSLITSRRPAQFNQCKICDISFYDEDKVDNHLVNIRFHRSKDRLSGFRASVERSYFTLSELFSKILMTYIYDYNSLIKSICDEFNYPFDDLQWGSYPLFPKIVDLKSAEDLVAPQMHSDVLHRSLGTVASSSSFKISRVRHTTITRGMEAGLDNIKLARLIGVTTAATRYYKDLTPESRRLINDRFCKNEILNQSFRWTLRDYNEHFSRIYTDELGQEIGGVKEHIGCSCCTKKLSAPLGCYACGADLFRPFLEANHQSQLAKAKDKQKFLEVTGANEHQRFEINFIIQRIEKVIELQEKHRKALDNNIQETSGE